MTLDLTIRQACLLLPAIKVELGVMPPPTRVEFRLMPAIGEELRNEGGSIDSDDAKALGVLMKVIDKRLRKGDPPMWTREYKGLYIRGFRDQSWTTVSWGSGEPVLADYKFKNIRAAQLFIDRFDQQRVLDACEV